MGAKRARSPRSQRAPRAPWRTARARSRVVLWAGFAAATARSSSCCCCSTAGSAELERSTTLARRAILLKVLEVVSKEAYSELKTAAEPAFHVDAGDLSDEGLDRSSPPASGARSARPCARSS